MHTGCSQRQSASSLKYDIMVQSMQVKEKWGFMKYRLSGLTYDDVNPTEAITSELAALAKHVSEW